MMGEAMLSGWIASETGPAASLGAGSFIVVEHSAERCVFLQNEYGVECVAHAEDAQDGDIVVLAVKPQSIDEVAEQIIGSGRFADSLFISIIAGTTLARLEALLPPAARIVRVMPNTPLTVGKGAVAICASQAGANEDEALVRDLFACLGEAVFVGEADLDAVTGVSGSGPAYVAAMIEYLARAGERQGLDYELAEKLALQTAYGTACLIRETGKSPAVVRESVCSPGGTTLAALGAMDALGIEAVYDAGVAAAVKRSKELGAC